MKSCREGDTSTAGLYMAVFPIQLQLEKFIPLVHSESPKNEKMYVPAPNCPSLLLKCGNKNN